MVELNSAQLDFIKKEHKDYISNVIEHRTTPRLKGLMDAYSDLFQKHMDNATSEASIELEKLLGIINDIIFEETYIAYCTAFQDSAK